MGNLFILYFLFVGTKRQFSSVIEDCALSCDSHYVNQRWLGGMLTNWSTIKTCIENLQLFCGFILRFIFLVMFFLFILFFYFLINLKFVITVKIFVFYSY